MKILIVGAGLAGCCLAHHLEEKDVTVKLIDAGINHSSKIAAGMINPMVFRRMLKSWMADEFIPYLTPFYRKVEKKVGTTFLHERTIKRVFSSQEEADLWEERSRENSYKPYLNEKNPLNNEPDYVISRFGSGYVNCPGYIDSPTFIQANHAYFLAKKTLYIEAFNYDELDVTTTHYKKEAFDYIIFAEGYHGKDNPFFNYLPLNLTKGEVLTVTASTLPSHEILNRKCFILPTFEGTIKVGATFAWNTTELNTTDEAREELLTHYNNLTTAPYELIQQEAGIRPTVIDRRPLMGKHPKHKRLVIFNGMGAKGYMHAPYLANHLMEHLLSDKELIPEVTIKRFEKKHYQK